MFRCPVFSGLVTASWTLLPRSCLQFEEKTGLAPPAPTASDDDLLDAAIAEVVSQEAVECRARLTPPYPTGESDEEAEIADLITSCLATLHSIDESFQDPQHLLLSPRDTLIFWRETREAVQGFLRQDVI